MDALYGGPFASTKMLTALSFSGVLFLGTAFTTAATILQQPPL